MLALFKLLTGIIADNTQDYLGENKIPPIEQKGDKRKSRGIKYQLLIKWFWRIANAEKLMYISSALIKNV